MNTQTEKNQLRAGMVGMGMIFDETYKPFFEQVHARGLYDRQFGDLDVPLTAVATRTGKRAERYRDSAGDSIHPFESYAGDDAVDKMLDLTSPSGRGAGSEGLDFACVATPDDRHFEAAKKILSAGVHLLVEKPSVLKLQELDELAALAREKNVLAKIVYHKLLDPDHKKLRTLYADDVLQHVNSGYCTLLEPKQISGAQFAEWITGRNPGTYVAVHYIKLIDFSFPGRLKTITAAGQRGIVGPRDGNTWDSTQMRMIYEYDSGREAAFDIHTSWVTPDNFPGYVEQEVQFRFDNGLWNGHSRKRGVECTVEGKTPFEMKISMNNHYNGTFLEPWGDRSQRGYGIEVIERFVRELAYVEFGGDEPSSIGGEPSSIGGEPSSIGGEPSSVRSRVRPRDDPAAYAARLAEMRQLAYNDLSADRQTVAAVQALEAILEKHYQGEPDCVVRVNDKNGGLVLYRPGFAEPEVLYEPRV